MFVFNGCKIAITLQKNLFQESKRALFLGTFLPKKEK